MEERTVLGAEAHKVGSRLHWSRCRLRMALLTNLGAVPFQTLRPGSSTTSALNGPADSGASLSMILSFFAAGMVATSLRKGESWNKFNYSSVIPRCRQPSDIWARSRIPCARKRCDRITSGGMTVLQVPPTAPIGQVVVWRECGRRCALPPRERFLLLNLDLRLRKGRPGSSRRVTESSLAVWGERSGGWRIDDGGSFDEVSTNRLVEIYAS